MNRVEIFAQKDAHQLTPLVHVMGISPISAACLSGAIYVTPFMLNTGAAGFKPWTEETHPAELNDGDLTVGDLLKLVR